MLYFRKEKNNLSLLTAIVSAAISGEQLSPSISTSQNYKNWVSVEDFKRCIICAKNHGCIWLITEIPLPEPPVHPNCRCIIEPMQAIKAGTATFVYKNGADWYLKQKQSLPNNYISQQKLKSLGWRRGKPISSFAKGMILTKGIYHNANGHLPYAEGRTWYEADINYKSGNRNSQRILWSSDGLIFVTYDHYKTFYEII